jgi:2,4-dienoyl-CoA reductase-like NADH-dependent reductase (Old Yellow Enzyme family)
MSTAGVTSAPDPRLDLLFRPLSVGSMRTANRIVMSPMTRFMSPGSVPGPEVAAYYRRRAADGVGLIITEATTVGHPLSAYEDQRAASVPDFHRPEALAGWKQVVDEVHAAGGCIAPQLWHMGLKRIADDRRGPQAEAIGPSGLQLPGVLNGRAMTQRDIDAVIDAFAAGAQAAQALGCDAVAIHGAHGYLIDLFLWGETNRRSDGYGGDLKARTRFASELVAEARNRVRADFPIIFRISQWKVPLYDARVADTPQDLEALLGPLCDAGVDVIDCSTRRFWEPAFPGSDLNLAGWAKKLTGRPSMTVGGVGLSSPMYADDIRRPAKPEGLERLLARLANDEFDLVGVGRGLVADAEWVSKVRAGRVAEINDYRRETLDTLY